MRPFREAFPLPVCCCKGPGGASFPPAGSLLSAPTRWPSSHTHCTREPGSSTCPCQRTVRTHGPAPEAGRFAPHAQAHPPSSGASPKSPGRRVLSEKAPALPHPSAAVRHCFSPPPLPPPNPPLPQASSEPGPAPRCGARRAGDAQSRRAGAGGRGCVPGAAVRVLVRRLPRPPGQLLGPPHARPRVRPRLMGLMAPAAGRAWPDWPPSAAAGPRRRRCGWRTSAGSRGCSCEPRFPVVIDCPVRASRALPVELGPGVVCKSEVPL